MKYQHKILLFAVGSFLSLLCTSCERDGNVPVYTLQITNEECSPLYTTAMVEVHIENSQSSYTYVLHYATSPDDSNKHQDFLRVKDGIYQTYLSNLEVNTTYYYWLEVKSLFGNIVYKEPRSFKTNNFTTPSVNTGDVEVVLSHQATCSSKVLDDGGKTIQQMGICYSDNTKSPTVSNKVVFAKIVGLGEFDCLLDSLEGSHTYYYRAFAKNNMGVSYGDIATFTTLSADLPEVTTYPVTNITENAAWCMGQVFTPLDVLPHTCGFCYSTHANPTIEDNAKSCDLENGIIETYLESLLPNTQYYVRAFAININGISYGEQYLFTTLINN